LLSVFALDTVANAKHYATVAAREKMSGKRFYLRENPLEGVLLANLPYILPI